MELSIIIPTHNFAPTLLLWRLAEQCASCAGLSRWEIIVVDDHSTFGLTELEQMGSLPHCRLLHTEQSGRAAARNMGIEAASFEWLLLCDSDAQVNTKGFIDSYVESAQNGTPVVIGGVKTTHECSQPNNQLRYRYETHAQKRHTLNYRQAHPYHNFSVFNALMRKSLFDSLLFDASLSKYGHEDTLLGVHLQRLGTPVLHIDNPLIHTGIDNNRSFLKKTEQGLENLHHLSTELQDVSPLIKFTRRLEKWHLVGIIRLMHRIISPIVRRQLLSRHPSLLLFKFYKVGYYLSIA